MAALELLEVWVQLRRVGEDGQSANVGTPTQIEIAVSANVDKLRKAVLVEFAPKLVGVVTADLDVSTSAEGDAKDPGDTVETLLETAGTTSKNPIFISAPPLAATVSASLPPATGAPPPLPPLRAIVWSCPRDRLNEERAPLWSLCRACPMVDLGRVWRSTSPASRTATISL